TGSQLFLSLRGRTLRSRRAIGSLSFEARRTCHRRGLCHEFSEPVSKAAPHPEAPFAARKRPRRMLQEAANGAPWNVLRGRFAAPQDEGTGLWVRLLYGCGRP